MPSFRIVESSPEISFFRLLEVSRATTFPWSMIAMRLHSISASTIVCVVTIIVVPFSLLSFFTNSRISTEDWGSSPSVGSSRNSTRGMFSRARTTFILWRIPVENVPTWAFFHLVSWTRSSSSSILCVSTSLGMSKRLPKNQRFSLAVRRSYIIIFSETMPISLRTSVSSFTMS